MGRGWTVLYSNPFFRKSEKQKMEMKKENKYVQEEHFEILFVERGNRAGASRRAAPDAPGDASGALIRGASAAVFRTSAAGRSSSSWVANKDLGLNFKLF